MSTTRLVLRQQMATELGLYESGTCTANGTTTTFIDTTRRKERDDYWNGSEFLFTAGTSALGFGKVSDFDQSGSVFTSATTVSPASDNTTVYDLYRGGFSMDAYNAAITSALDEAYTLGFAERGYDETLYTTRQRKYSLPSSILGLSEVRLTATNRLLDPAWWGSGAGWTLHIDATFGNNGDNQERTLNHASSGANHYSTCKISVTPGVEYQFRVRALSVAATPVAVARYQFLTAAGALIGSATNFGTYALSSSGLITGTFVAPVGAYMVQIGLGSSSATGTVRFWEHNLWERGDERPFPHEDWEVDWNAVTPTLLFKHGPPPVNRTLILLGKARLSAIAADTDTLSYGVPESRAFINLALANLWEQTIGQIPNVDRAQAQENAAFRRSKFHELGKGYFENWRQNRTVSVPRF